MNLEVKQGSTNFIFSFTNYVNDVESNISTADIVIQNNAGTELVSSTSMTISGATATYTLNASNTTNYPIDRNFKAILTIDGIDRVRLFDVVKYPFVNEVNIDSLRKENRSALELAGFKYDGDSESGTTSTLIDSSLIGQDTFAGGEITIYPLDNNVRAESFTVTDFNDSTGEITFSPARSTAITSERFTIRRSFKEDIERASVIVQSDLWKKNKRAYLILDNTQINNMIIYKFFERMFGKKKTTNNDDDSNYVQYIYYKDLYMSEFEGLPLVYDLNENGHIDDNEEFIKDSVRFLR